MRDDMLDFGWMLGGGTDKHGSVFSALCPGRVRLQIKMILTAKGNFTVELERLTREIEGETETMSLRATSVYRREDGAWKVIHRHGDGLMTVEIDPEGRR